ncbi:perlucin-like protein [Branchiostoma floridae x Branchiostoma belcheri]
MVMESVFVILAVLVSLQEASGQTVNVNVNMPEGAVQSLLMADLQEKNLKLEFENAELKELICACKEQTHVCPSGYTKHCDMCYSFSTDTKNYTNARSACHAAGGHLAMPKDQATNDFLVNSFKGRYSYSVWIGLTRKSNMGNSWTWEDGTPLVGWKNWATGRPQSPLSPYGGHRACWGHFYGHKWVDTRGQYDLYYVCEKPATAKP